MALAVVSLHVLGFAALLAFVTSGDHAGKGDLALGGSTNGGRGT